MRNVADEGVLGVVAAALDQRLLKAASAPLAVAFSGGGDSLGLLIAAKAWADRNARRLVALTVDHGLQAASADWARACQAWCRQAGVGHEILPWTDRGGVGARADQARRARHGLLAQAARSHGARAILMGHTRDDLLEARAMRAAGVRLGDPAAWSPSPVWPQGRSVFLLRPLLTIGRSRIRAFLVGLGETWIDDPANDDVQSARARARRVIAAGEQVAMTGKVVAGCPSPGLVLLGLARVGLGGDIQLARSDLRSAPPRVAHAFLGAALLCAAGTDRPAAAASLDRLRGRLQGREAFAAGLAGARVEADGEGVAIMREPGDLARRGPAQTIDGVWDGRFAVAPDLAPGDLRPLGGLLGRLAPRDRKALRTVPAAARRALPAVALTNGKAICAILAREHRPGASSLVRLRLAAALGAVANEADCERMIGEMAQPDLAS